MCLYLLLITLFINVILLYKANKYQEKLNIGKLFLYIQLAVTFLNCCNIIEFCLDKMMLPSLISFIQCASYAGIFIILYLIYLTSVAINNINFKIEKYFALFTPTIIAVSLFISNSFTHFMINADFNEGVLFNPFYYYHLILGIFAIYHILSKRENDTLISPKASLFFIISIGIFLIHTILKKYNIVNIIDESSSMYLTVISITLYYIVKNFKYET